MSFNSKTLGFLTVLVSISIATLFIGPINIFNHPDSGFILSFRGLRLACALCVGALLAGSGASLQGALRNPLADPYILGISSGAGLGASLSVACLPPQIGIIGLPIAALAGAVTTTLLLMMGIRWIGRFTPSYFTLVGVAINAMFSALTMLVMTLTGPKMAWVITWLMGDFSQSTPLQLALTLPIGALGGWMLLRQAPALDALSLGDDLAQTFGFNPEKTRKTVIMTCSILTGLAVALAGIIGFVALVVPHIVRSLGSRHHHALITQSAIAGSIALAGCDLLLRLVLPEQGLPVGIMCALIGAPLFFVLLWKSRHDG